LKGYILYRYSDYLPYLLVRQSLKPKQNQSPVDQSETVYPIVQPFSLQRTVTDILIRIHLHAERDMPASTLHFPTQIKTAIHADTIDPSPQICLTPESIIPCPKSQQHLLKQVIQLFPVV